MKNYINITFNFTMLLILIGCVENQKKSNTIENEGWIKETKVSKMIKNVNFIFPDSGYAFDNKEDLINRSFDAIEHNIKILGKTKFTDTIYVRVMSSFDEMFVHTGSRAAGNAYSYWRTVNIVVNENEINPPIEHELMHLITLLDWDYSKRSSTWMGEGIATFSANECNGNTVEEIYRYLLEENKLISIEDLTDDFYGLSEMVSYHQSGYIVQHLLENYSIEQFKRLWIEGFEKFEEIYEVPYSKVKTDLEKAVIEKYPKTPEIDWEVFNKGCQ